MEKRKKKIQRLLFTLVRCGDICRWTKTKPRTGGSDPCCVVVCRDVKEKETETWMAPGITRAQRSVGESKHTESSEWHPQQRGGGIIGTWTCVFRFIFDCRHIRHHIIYKTCSTSRRRGGKMEMCVGNARKSKKLEQQQCIVRSFVECGCGGKCVLKIDANERKDKN